MDAKDKHNLRRITNFEYELIIFPMKLEIATDFEAVKFIGTQNQFLFNPYLLI